VINELHDDIALLRYRCYETRLSRIHNHMRGSSSFNVTLSTVHHSQPLSKLSKFSASKADNSFHSSSRQSSRAIRNEKVSFEKVGFQRFPTRPRPSRSGHGYSFQLAKTH
jgi:hypothetical protein